MPILKHKLTKTLITSVTTLASNQSVIAANVANEAIAKHIILFIGDGMNIEHEIAASRYLYGDDFALSFHKLPYKGNVATWDIDTYKHWSGGSYNPDAIVPKLGYNVDKVGNKPYPLSSEKPGAQEYCIAMAGDSAAAATAMATGYKTEDGNVAWIFGDKDIGGNRNNDGSLQTITELLRANKGYSIGVVSTVPFSHATPASFVSHNKNRGDYFRIASEILTVTKPDVVIGGGHPGYDANPIYKFISAEDYAALKSGQYANEYVFVERTAMQDGAIALFKAVEQALLSDKKLFGLFGIKGLGNFESMEPQDFPDLPVVRRKTYENPSLAETTLAALQVLSKNQNGMFLMAEQGDIDWANHANDFSRMIGNVSDLHNAVQAVIDFVNRPGDAINWNNTLLISTSDHSHSYMRNKTKLGAGNLPQQEGQCNYGATPPCTYPKGEITYVSNNHSNELVRLYAKGVGIDLLRKYENNDWYGKNRILDNTHIFHVMMEAAGLPQPPRINLAK